MEKSSKFKKYDSSYAFCSLSYYGKSQMIGLEPLYDFVSLCLWTGAVEGERPASAIIVAPPGSGKTSVLERYKGESSPFVSDLTSREISNIVRDHPRATHILLSDMMALFSHKGPVVNLSCSMLGALTGDSLRTDGFSGRDTGGKKMGLITAIPTYDLKKRKIQSILNGAGFATRFMLIHYDYSVDTKMKIHEYIKADLYTTESAPDPFKLPPDREAVYIPSDLATTIHALSQVVKPEGDLIGTRIHLHLRALCKARARREGRPEATREDVEAITAYSEFFGPNGKLL